MRKILSVLSLAMLALLVGCGSSHNRIEIPPDPSGGNDAGFSNATMTGTYVFSVHGFNARSINGEFFTVLGSFTANGDGTISGGTRDTVSDLGRRTLDESIASTSSYFINADGRGQVILDGRSGQAIYRIVMQSADKGSLFQDGTGTHSVVTDAVGTIQLQSGTPASPTGPYIFRLDGEDSFLAPYGAIGEVTISGAAMTGFLDENDNGVFNGNISGGPLNANGDIALAGGRGTASLSTPSGPNAGTHHFVVYFVSATRIELMSTDTNFVLYGHAEAQNSFSPTVAGLASSAPEQVLSLAGFDQNGARLEMGRATLTSSGTLLNAIEDISTTTRLFSSVNLSGSTFAVGQFGRWTANLVNSSGAPSPALVAWQVSPGRSIVLTSDQNDVETGTLEAQTLGLTTADVSGDFAERLAGFDATSFQNVELTGNLRLDGIGAFSGTFDAQSDNTGLSLDTATSGSYAVDPTLGRSTTSVIQGYPVVLYSVDAHTVYFLPSSARVVFQGALLQQTP